MKFGKVAGRMSCVEKEFKLVPHKYEDYKGLRFYNGDYVLVVHVCLYRVEEDTRSHLSGMGPVSGC